MTRVVKAILVLGAVTVVVVASFVAGAVFSVFTHTGPPEPSPAASDAQPVPQLPADETRPAVAPPDSLAGGDLARASALFGAHCAACHMRSGTGEAHHRRDGIPDFTDGAWQARRPDDALLASVMDGKGPVMPAFRGRLTEDAARLLVRFVRGFPAHAAGTAPGAPERASPQGAEHEEHRHGGRSGHP